MREPQQGRPAHFKIQVALAALQSERTPRELSEQFDVHPDQIDEWKRHALEHLIAAFGPSSEE